jgi:hypothetical protein
MRRALATLLTLLAAAPALQPAPADADATVVSGPFALEVPDEVLYPGCSSYTFALDPALPAAAEGWYLDLTVRGPGGGVVHEDTLSDYYSTAEYLDHMWICSADTRPGKFTMKATGAWRDADWEDTPVSFSATFSLRLPRSVTTLRAVNANPRPDTWAKLKSLVVAETRRGLDASKFTAVVLQRLNAGRWVTVKGSRTITDKYGEATFRYRYRGGRVSLRARAMPVEVAASTSLRVVLR